MAASGATILLLSIFLLEVFPRASFNQGHNIKRRVCLMFYVSFTKLIIYDLLLIVLKLMAVFGQYIEIKTKIKIIKMK